jgi:tRNA(Glu) U13 pseudouridine synthase TruD
MASQVKCQHVYWRRSVREKSHHQVANQPIAKKRRVEDVHTAQDHSASDTVCADLCIAAPIQAASEEQVWLILPRFVEFTLVKNDVEHSEAVRIISEALQDLPVHGILRQGVDLSYVSSIIRGVKRAIAVCGTKDRRGVTVQRCSVEVLPKWASRVAAEGRMDVAAPLQGKGAVLSAILQAAAMKLLQINRASDRVDTFPEPRRIRVGDIRFTHATLEMGAHWGNHFEIVLRNASPVCVEPGSRCLMCYFQRDRIPQVQAAGFPNYFGGQRFGYLTAGSEDADDDVTDASARSFNLDPGADYMPIGPFVGKCLLQRRFADAFHTVIMGDVRAAAIGSQCYYCRLTATRPSVPEIEQLTPLNKARALYAMGKRPSVVLRSVPSALTKERWLLQGLVRQGDRNSFGEACSCGLSAQKECGSLFTDVDKANAFESAFDNVPHNIRLMWIHSYQSWIWNKVCSFRLFGHSREVARSYSVQIGDLLCSREHDSVSRENVSLCVVPDGHIADLVLPLFGSNIVFPENESGRFGFGVHLL